eukprot:TRINITY_DN63667_c0_g1_i1.p1 TRINITY_DN63667_c0_g1~~TRINITY_DN63667_c0_g1_i1.p1  ORF type:complete len:179 (-),score=37.29 TRINITY_DN63667_c0_g1_i1:155-691(-)
MSFNSMADVRRKQEEEKEEKRKRAEEKKGGPAEFYTGGAKSGMAVVGPEDEASEATGQESASAAAPASTAFAGEGITLGGGSSAAAAPVTVQTEAGSVQLDSSKPTTKVQIRFPDGQRRAQEFNQDHTVGDLRSFCIQCVGGQSMAIMGGFPPKELTDDSVTLKAGGLCGAAVSLRPN